MSYSMRRSFGSAAADAGNWLLDQAQAGCEKAGGNFYRDVARCDCGEKGDLYKNGQCVKVDTQDDFYEMCRQQGGTIKTDPDGFLCEPSADCRGTACKWNTDPDTWVGGAADSGTASSGSKTSTGSKTTSSRTGSSTSSTTDPDWNKYAMYGAAVVGGGVLLMLLF